MTLVCWPLVLLSLGLTFVCDPVRSYEKDSQVEAKQFFKFSGRKDKILSLQLKVYIMYYHALLLYTQKWIKQDSC